MRLERNLIYKIEKKFDDIIDHEIPDQLFYDWIESLEPIRWMSDYYIELKIEMEGIFER